jgi:hypothetical protein
VTNSSGSETGPEGAQGRGARAGDPFSSSGAGDAGGAGRGLAGGNDPQHSSAGASPGGDAGSQIGGDDEFDARLRDDPDPAQGIAARAAQEQPTGADVDSLVQDPSGPGSKTTPGYTP